LICQSPIEQILSRYFAQKSRVPKHSA
jgi:hypothetical protein